MTTASRINWWGLANTAALVVWFVCASGGVQNLSQTILVWGGLIMVHILAAVATVRHRFGSIYLLPPATIWILALVGFLNR